MINFENISKFYNGDPALDSINLSVSAGEFISIVGQSGAGKTTLIKLILAEEKPTSGSVFFDSVDIHSLKNNAITKMRRRMGVIFQDFRLLPRKTVYENIAFAMETAGKTDEEIETDVPYILDLVDIKSKALLFPHQLSGGEKQRLAIARAIINQPEVIIADEPTGNLDPINTNEVIQILKKINDLGTTVILTTHNPRIIDSLKKRVVSMEKGKIISDNEKGKYKI
ncbi:cell division ATP-binding protein FtsE [Candidatus Nomurabacteria bacterium RIFCSPLOWO2_01_FULL_33_24]|uniref:Cell division ATP-binding protein FtsE n=1 Tax=Candidatus Nomurabacteria bacterium RIFCSPLOWO2_01_FULL_33_24 TaxID=1801765 RepID=A0A1F6WYP7_9BACT|nr:MAG: cell division ATP-binding protein FtsE [Candidatus Nomurabacteria bacterium RIFCSPLOWO2_01_FULL_33_24]